MLSRFNRRLLSVAVLSTSLMGLTACMEPKSNNEKVLTSPSEVIDKPLKELLNFNDGLPSWVISNNTNISLVDSPIESGKTALSIDFLRGTYSPSVVIRPETPWNLTSESDFNIALDVKNTGEESIQLYLSVTNTSGSNNGIKLSGASDNTVNRAITLAPGESGTYYAVLDGDWVDLDTGLRESPPPWQSDEEMFVYRFGNRTAELKEISEISLFVRGNLTPKSIVVDNIRIRKNPESDTQSLVGLLDEFGQNAKQDYPIKINSEQELKQAADAEVAELNRSGLMADRSRFGGWKDGPKFEGTGFFRTTKHEGQWWMVDPDGYLFFSHGVANVRMANLSTITGIDFKDPSVREVDSSEVTPEDSIGSVGVSDKVRATKYVASDMRRNMFTWLPEYDSDLADHYSYRRSVHKGPQKSGETYSFYRANLERRYGQTSPDSYIKKWEEVTLARMQDWGFTSMGNWVDPAFYPNEKVPYFANGWIIGDFKTLSSKYDHWAPMPDSFDPEFIRRAKLTIDIIAEEVKSSPWCVGIFVDNEKSWGFREGTIEQRFGLILDALSKSTTESPAKSAFTKYLKDKYSNDIQILNEHWSSKYQSWSVLEKGVDLVSFNDNMEEDLSNMLELLSDQYFKVVHDAVAKALPNHLYMGARMANWGMPNETIKAAVKYSDVMSFNIYEEGLQPEAWSFLKDIDLPTVIGEFHIGSTTDTGVYHAGLVQADGQAARAEKYLAYMDSVVKHPNMVGAHWFQYVDSPITGRAFDGENYNVGFVAVTDIPYPEMVEATKKFNKALYPYRSSLAKQK